jgi:hypothetical protein
MAFISFSTKVIFSVVVAGLWVFFRTENSDELLPTHSFFAVLFVMVGVALNYYDPLFFPLFLLLLFLYSKFINI